LADTKRRATGKWQAAILKAEQNRLRLRLVSGDKSRPGAGSSSQ